MHNLFKHRLFDRAILIAAIGFALSLPAVAQSAILASQSKASSAVLQSGAPTPLSGQATPAIAPSPASPEELREAQIQSDTKKLYQLALELRTEVGKTYKESLSLAVLKKAEELEKLAKALKSEMIREASAKKQ